MVYMYTGRPRNGKSLHAASVIYHALLCGKNVIANFEINEEYFSKVKHPDELGSFIYEPNYWWSHNAYTSRLTLDPAGDGSTFYGVIPQGRYSYFDGLRSFARQFHKKDAKGHMIESQTYLVIDECSDILDNRMWRNPDRSEWSAFLREHGKYGFDVILITQHEDMVDKQLRELVQYRVIHRDMSRISLGKFMSWVKRCKVFAYVVYDNSMPLKEGKIDSGFFTGKKFYDFYDSYKTFH